MLNCIIQSTLCGCNCGKTFLMGKYFKCNDPEHDKSTSRRLYGKNCFKSKRKGDISGQCLKCCRRVHNKVIEIC